MGPREKEWKNRKEEGSRMWEGSLQAVDSCSEARGRSTATEVGAELVPWCFHPTPSPTPTISWDLGYVSMFLFSTAISPFLVHIYNHSLLTPDFSFFSSVQFSRSVVFDSLRPHGLQDARPPCPSPSPGVYSNSCPLSWWCHPPISSSVVLFSSCLQCFPASGSFQMSQFLALGGQSIGVSASTSVLPMNIQDWSPLEWTGWISLQSKGLSRVFSNTTVQKHQFFGTQLSLWSNSHIHTWLLEKS